MDGDPPDLPASGFSDLSRDFVRKCLHKVPKMRPTYAMLINHPWLVPLLKPPTITEVDEEAGSLEDDLSSALSLTADQEVAAWVMTAMEKRRNGRLGNSAKPALHAAPLQAVPSPLSPL